MSVYEKLLMVQSELKAPKNQHNNFGNYNYRSAEDILEAVKPLCAIHKATITLSDKPVFISPRFYIEATATFTDVENSDHISVTAYAREDDSKKGMDGAQVTGAASSYARKYALNGLLCVDDTKDADGLPPQQRQNQMKCEVCGKPIKDSKKRNGDPWPAADIVNFSTSRFGRCLCPGCQRKAFETQKEASQ